MVLSMHFDNETEHVFLRSVPWLQRLILGNNSVLEAPVNILLPFFSFVDL